MEEKNELLESVKSELEAEKALAGKTSEVSEEFKEKQTGAAAEEITETAERHEDGETAEHAEKSGEYDKNEEDGRDVTQEILSIIQSDREAEFICEDRKSVV